MREAQSRVTNYKLQVKKPWVFIASCLLLIVWGTGAVFASQGNIDSTNKYAWSENSGWQNWRPTHSGGYVNKNYLEGYIWCENVGWVRLGTGSGGVSGDPLQYANTDATNYGVNNDGSGNLSGYAWSENAGWINFNPTHSQVTVDTSTGEFNGYAWSENLGWVHFKNASPAYNVQTDWPTVTWDGSSSTDWDTGANWDSGAVPASTDTAVIADVANQPVLASSASIDNLTVNSSATVDLAGNDLTVSSTVTNNGTVILDGDEAVSWTNDITSGTVKYDGAGDYTGSTGLAAGDSYYNLEFDGSGSWDLDAALDVDGRFDLTNGSFNMNGQNMNVAGDWTNSGIFTAGASTVTFDGSGQSISGGTTFYNLDKTVASADTLTFDNTAEQAISNSLTLQGASGQLLSLRSDSPGSQYNINLQAGGTQNLSYLDVKDSNASGLTLDGGTTSTGASDNNTNWIFGTGTTYTWDGSSSTDWDTAVNWDLGAVPGVNDTAVIADVANQPVLASSTSIDNLTVNSSATVDLAGNDLTVSSTVTNNGTVILDGDEAVSWTNDTTSGTVRYDGAGDYTGSTGLAAGDSYYNLEFDGSGSWDLDAALDVDGRFDLTNGSFNMNGQNMNVAGDFTLASGAAFTKGIGTLIFDGDLRFADNTALGQNLGAVQIGASPDTTTLDSDMTADSLTIDAGDTLVTNGYNLTVSGDLTVNGTLDASDGDGGSTTINVEGDWTNSGTFTAGASTVTFDGSVAQSISGTLTAANGKFYNLTVDNSHASPDDTNDVDATQIEVAGTLTIDDGQFQPADNSDFADVTINANGILKPDSSATITVSGDWTNSGTFTAGASTVTFDGSATETAISGETTFNNLSCTTASKTIKFTQGTNQTVNGTFTLTGGSGAGEKITVKSTANTQKWDITFPNGTQTVSYADVRDSDANTNSVACYNSTDSGNNNANWVFNTVAITSPTAGKTVDTSATVIGTAGAGDTVIIKDVGAVTVATTTADANGNFRVEATGLAEGGNSLTPYVGAIAGATVNITVDADASSDPNLVPNFTSISDGSTIAGKTPAISGEGAAGEVVTLTAKDENGNLLLTDVATATVDGAGTYTFSQSDYTTDLSGGTNYLSVTVDGVTSGVINVNFVDPFGVVFDSVTNNPIEGAVVTLWYQHPVAGWRVAIPGTDINAGEENPQTTGADGMYQYTVVHPPNTNLRLEISAAGYTFPTTKLPLAANFPTRTFDDTDGAVGEEFAFTGIILNIDMPMDPDSNLLKITKDANKKEVVIGDIVTYTVTIQNPTAGDVTAVYLEDKIPAGFKYLDGKAILDGTQISDPTGNRPLTFNIGTVSAGQTRTLKYQLVIGSGVTFGKYENSAFAKYSDGTVISNTATETVKVIPDPLFDLGTVIGKVFWDWDEDGIQRSQVTRHKSQVESYELEMGVPNVRIVMEDGTVIITDKDGKYHVPGIIPGRHAFRLDESTLPEGTYLTTPKVVIVDIRQGLTSKVNFGVSRDDKSQVTSHTSHVKIIQEREMPEPRLNVALNKDTLEVRDIGGLKEAATFRIFTNYSLFIDKWQLDVFDKSTKRLFKRFEGKGNVLSEPIYWSGAGSSGSFVRPDRTYTYILTVWDKQGKFDKTREREFRVSGYTPEIAHKKEELEKEIFGEEKSKSDEEKLWITERQVNNLDIQSIALAGETIKVTSHQLPVTSIRLMKGSRLEGEIPVQQQKLTAKELLERPQFEAESETEAIEIIIPNGEYEVQVLSQQSEVTSAKSQVTSHKSQVKNVQPVYSKHITVGDDYFFFIAMADGEMGYNFKSGNTEPIEPSEDNDRFKKGLWLDGKLAYYLKAKIKGKYLITSSLDTQRDQKELFRYIDPDKYYPVYGDNSQISYEASDTQGMLYAMVEWDRSEVMWGNYNVAFTDTEFAKFQRTLYGGKTQLISTSDTKFGEPNTKIITFMAKAKQKAAHNEFTGTGGSLYYLKHKYVVEGSDKVKIEVRDKITGLVLSELEQKEGSDYEIDYDNGRIIFWKPVSQIAQAESIISGQLLDGNRLYVVADYEYYTKDKHEEWSKGARVSQQLGDYLRVGGTYVEDNNQAKKNYELYGADTTVRLGDNIKLDAEYAESASEQGNNFISTDGGLSFTELATDETAEGKAYGVSGEAKLFDNLGLSAYYKRIESGFSTSSAIANQGTEKIGGEASLEILPGTRISARHDIQELVDDGNLESRTQVGAEKTETTSVQVISELSEKLEATAEYRRQRVSGKKDEYESETNEDADIIAGKLAYKLTDKTIVSARYQESLSGENNRQGALGAETMLTEHIGVRGEGILGSEGNAATAGITANVQDKFDLFADYTISDDRENGHGRTVTAGGKAKVDDNTSIYNTYSVTDSDRGEQTETVVLGTKKKLDKGYEVSMGREFSKEGEKFASANTYGIAKDIEGRRIEGTFKEESANEEGNISHSNIFGLSGDIDDKWAASFNFEKGKVQNVDGTRTKRIAVSGGASYVEEDKIKASSKLEFRHDDSSEDSWQILAYNAVESKMTEDLTLFAKANISYTENTSTDSTMANFKEMVLGAAYRPIYHDRLNLIGKYTFLEDESPSSQDDFKDIEHIKAHVFGLEAIYDLTDKFQIAEKAAFKYQDEKVSGFDFTDTQTWLLVNRLNYNLDKNWQVSGEYRMLGVVQAEDLKQGALLEISRRIGEFVKVGAGYNFTDFSDDLTDLDYTVHGPFIRMTGVLYDRTPQEIERAKKRELERNIEKWAWEIVNSELARPESKIMKELYNYFKLAEIARDEGRLEEAKELYAKIQDRAQKLYEQAESYVRERVEFENRLKNYNTLAGIYYKEGKLLEARELWQKIITESKSGVRR